MTSSRLIKRLYLVIVFLIICYTGVVVFFYNRKKIEHVPEQIIQNKPYQRTKIHRFQVNIFDGDKKLLLIKGDSFTVEKKKIGFLRTSLFNEAILKNGIIELHSNGFFNDSDGTQVSKISFKKAVSKDNFSFVYSKNVSSIKVEPVSISLYQGDKLVTKICAQTGQIRVLQKDIFFSGKVIVESGTSKLTTESLSFHPDDAMIETKSAYELSTDEGHFQGTRFQANIFLKSES